MPGNEFPGILKRSSNYESNFNSNDFSESPGNEFPGISKRSNDDESLMDDSDENILDSNIFRLLTYFPLFQESEESTVRQNL